MTDSSYTDGNPDRVEGPGYVIVVEALSDILELSISGQATLENAYEIAERVTDITTRHRKPVLMDVRTVKGRLGVADTYYHVRRDRPQEQSKWKTAVVDLSENASYYEFHQTTATNVGFFIRYFNTPEDARAWLRE